MSEHPGPSMDAETRAAHAAHALHVATGEGVPVGDPAGAFRSHLKPGEEIGDIFIFTPHPAPEPVKTNRQAHEEAAGMGLEYAFFKLNGIDPDAPAPEPVLAPTVDAGPEIDATFAKIREIMEESKPWRNEYELAEGDVVREDDRLWNGTKTSEVHYWDGTSVRKARAACGNIGLRFFRKGPAPRAESAPDAQDARIAELREELRRAWFKIPCNAVEKLRRLQFLAKLEPKP